MGNAKSSSGRGGGQQDTECGAPISYWLLLLDQKSRLGKPMGNAKSSSRGGGCSLKAATLAAVAVAAVAYGWHKLMSHTEAEEDVSPGAANAVWYSVSSESSSSEEEEERMADPRMPERACGSSSSPYIREGKGPSTGVHFQAKVEENLPTGPYNEMCNNKSMQAITGTAAVAVSSPPCKRNFDRCRLHPGGRESAVVGVVHCATTNESNDSCCRQAKAEEKLRTGQRSDWSLENHFILEGNYVDKGMHKLMQAITGAAAVAVWFRPPEGWVKLNTDFSGPSHFSGPSGMGIIIRDHLGKLLWCSAEQVEDPIIRTDEGEAFALLRGLQVAISRGYKKVVAETDHESNANSINNVRCKGSRLIQRIRQAKCSWFEECQIRHIMREGNQCADHVARAARSGSIPFKTLRYSGDLQKHLQKDKNSLLVLIEEVVPDEICNLLSSFLASRQKTLSFSYV